MACSCGGPDNFCSTINQSPNATNLIIRAEKLSAYHYGMYVRPIDILEGNEARDSILVWGDNGALCRLYTDFFNDGDTLILALQPCDLSGNWITVGNPDTLEDSSHYQLSVCGVFQLAFSGGTVSGEIDGRNTSAQWADFRNTYRSCDTLGLPENPGVNFSISFDHVAQKLVVHSSAITSYNFQIEMINTSGQILLSEFASFASNQSFNVPELVPGVYIATARGLTSQQSVKILIGR